MRFVPVIVIFIYIYLEICLFVAVANSIGVFLALLCIIATSIIGFSLVKSQGLKNFSLMRQKMINRENPTNEIIKSGSLLAAGFLLLIPGFLTDILGVLLLLTPVQQLLSRFIVPNLMLATLLNRSKKKKPTAPASNDDIIEGDFRRKNDE